jgi:hypothetical protein
MVSEWFRRQVLAISAGGASQSVIVVDPSGAGDFTTIEDAADSLPNIIFPTAALRRKIYVLGGTYHPTRTIDLPTWCTLECDSLALVQDDLLPPGSTVVRCNGRGSGGAGINVRNIFIQLFFGNAIVGFSFGGNQITVAYCAVLGPDPPAPQFGTSFLVIDPGALLNNEFISLDYCFVANTVYGVFKDEFVPHVVAAPGSFFINDSQFQSISGEAIHIYDDTNFIGDYQFTNIVFRYNARDIRMSTNIQLSGMQSIDIGAASTKIELNNAQGHSSTSQSSSLSNIRVRTQNTQRIFSVAANVDNWNLTNFDFYNGNSTTDSILIGSNCSHFTISNGIVERNRIQFSGCSHFRVTDVILRNGGGASTQGFFFSNCIHAHISISVENANEGIVLVNSTQQCVFQGCISQNNTVTNINIAAGSNNNEVSGNFFDLISAPAKTVDAGANNGTGGGPVIAIPLCNH